MKNKKKTTKDIIKNGYGNAFSSKELLEFYKINEVDLKEAVFYKEFMSNVKRGVYFKNQIMHYRFFM